MEILDRLEHLDLAVIPAKMELQVPKVLPVLLVPMVNVVLLVLLELVASRFGRLNSALLFMLTRFRIWPIISFWNNLYSLMRG